VTLHGPRQENQRQEELELMKELLAELMTLRKQLETLQVKLEQVDKPRRNKQRNKPRRQFQALEESLLTPHKPYSRQVH